MLPGRRVLETPVLGGSSLARVSASQGHLTGNRSPYFPVGEGALARDRGKPVMMTCTRGAQGRRHKPSFPHPGETA